MIKFSQFNSIIKHNEQFALYNSFNDRVIFLVPELKDFLKAAIAEGVEGMREYHPTFYDYLLRKEFLVDASIDEVGKVREIVKKVDENEDDFILTINPTMNCNFKCWYCYETHIKQSKLDEIATNKITKFIYKVTNDPKIKTFNLAFFGGEPLLYFEKTVVPIADYYIEKCLEKNIRPEIGFTTNGYLINENFINYFAKKNLKCGLQITLDGYKEDHDKVRFVNSKTGSYDKIVKNIHLLIENHFYVRVRVNYTDKNIQNSQKVLNDFLSIPKDIREKYLMFDFHRVWQDADGEDVNAVLEETRKSFDDHGLITKGQTSMNNVVDSCYADKRNSVTINYNGDIYKCTARDFKPENREGYIDDNGDLIWLNDSLNKRMNIKFKNKPCLSCRIMPLCNGGCSQAAMEHEGVDYCVFDGDESLKDQVVVSKIKDIIEQVSKKDGVKEESVLA